MNNIELRNEVVNEAKLAFKLNADIYTEQPYFLVGAVGGIINLSSGLLKRTMK